MIKSAAAAHVLALCPTMGTVPDLQISTPTPVKLLLQVASDQKLELTVQCETHDQQLDVCICFQLIVIQAWLNHLFPGFYNVRKRQLFYCV